MDSSRLRARAISEDIDLGSNAEESKKRPKLAKELSKHDTTILALCLTSPLLQADRQREIEALTASITEACRSGDLAAIRRCYDVAGVSKKSLDRSISGWRQMFSEKSPENGYVFSDVKFVPLETLRQKPPSDEKRGEMSETVKDTIIRANAASEEILKKVTKPIEIDGALWKYNVDVIGFVIINFKKEDLQSGTGQPVGIAPDGSLCFASLIPMSH